MDLFSFTDDPEDSIPEGEWPDTNRFPTNSGSHRVENQVYQDLRGSFHASIVTGFASLDRIIDFAVSLEKTKINLLIGSEPIPSKKKSFQLTKYDFPDKLNEAW